MSILVLFDIDNTLMKNAVSHRLAYEDAFARIYHTQAGLDLINPHGMTDQQIIVTIMRMSGVDEKTIRSRLGDCIRAIEKSFAAFFEEEEAVVLPGTVEVLAELEKRNVLMGLVTGNIEAIARLKLSRAGLERYFKTGGFGSDHEDRTELVRIAVSGAERLGFPAGGKVFLVGDTPRDIAAGLEAGVVTVGTATGIFTADQLHEAGAHHVVPGFDPARRFLRIIGVRET